MQLTAESWRRRRLGIYFGRRFNEKRYLRTYLGRIWIVLRPLFIVVSQVLVFGGILSVAPGSEVPYIVAFLAGFIGWWLFAEVAYWSTRALELNRRALRELYIPRLVVLLGACAPALIDCLILVGLFGMAIVFFVIADGTTYLQLDQAYLAIAGFLILLLLGLSIGAWLSVPGAAARDIRFGLRFVLNFWYLLTPVIYPLSTVPDQYRFLIELNPVTFPIELIKRGLLGAGELLLISGVSTLAMVLLVGGGGLIFYSRAESAALDHL